MMILNDKPLRRGHAETYCSNEKDNNVSKRNMGSCIKYTKFLKFYIFPVYFELLFNIVFVFSLYTCISYNVVRACLMRRVQRSVSGNSFAQHEASTNIDVPVYWFEITLTMFSSVKLDRVLLPEKTTNNKVTAHKSVNGPINVVLTKSSGG